ncbi:MAG: hypothetical protein Q8Q59_10190 [Luteolibacter sp.]|jgi:hypothetical protein|nr:hypothetical protein [Luteolibacter sp.]
MKHVFWSVIAICATLLGAVGQVRIDEEALGKSLGGWTKRAKQAAEYPLSGATYRTYKPEISPTPDGGIFVSVRIDHVRGWLSSDDHATLELTVNAKGMVESAQTNIAIQGRSISSDLILGVAGAGPQAVGMDRAVQIGTDLVANLSAKLLREKIVEAGRVSFPAAVRHNYNRLFQAIRMEEKAAEASAPVPPVETEKSAAPEKPAEPGKPADSAAEPSSDTAPPLNIQPFGEPVPVKPKG